MRCARRNGGGEGAEGVLGYLCSSDFLSMDFDVRRSMLGETLFVGRDFSSSMPFTRDFFSINPSHQPPRRVTAQVETPGWMQAAHSAWTRSLP